MSPAEVRASHTELQVEFRAEPPALKVGLSPKASQHAKLAPASLPCPCPCPCPAPDPGTTTNPKPRTPLTIDPWDFDSPEALEQQTVRGRADSMKTGFLLLALAAAPGIMRLC